MGKAEMAARFNWKRLRFPFSLWTGRDWVRCETWTNPSISNTNCSGLESSTSWPKMFCNFHLERRKIEIWAAGKKSWFPKPPALPFPLNQTWLVQGESGNRNLFQIATCFKETVTLVKHSKSWIRRILKGQTGNLRIGVKWYSAIRRTQFSRTNFS